jgi:hypothetical protein
METAKDGRPPKLHKEFEYYLAHQDELVAKYNGKYVVIKGQQVIGAYDDIREAVDTTAKTQQMGTFLVQKCTPGDNDYTRSFRSRVA